MDNLWIKFVQHGEIHVGEVVHTNEERLAGFDKTVYWVPHFGMIPADQILEIRSRNGLEYIRD